MVNVLSPKELYVGRKDPEACHPKETKDICDNFKMIALSINHMQCFGNNLNSNNENIYFFTTEYGKKMNIPSMNHYLHSIYTIRLTPLVF